MKKLFFFSFLLLLLSCNKDVNEDIQSVDGGNTNYIELGNGLSYRMVDAESNLAEILLWNDLLSSTRSSSDVSIIDKKIWSEVKINDNSDIKVIIQKNVDDLMNSVAYYSYKGIIVAQYNIQISEVNSIIHIKYSDVKTDDFFEIKIDENGEIITEPTTRTLFGKWASQTSECIVDAYKNHGWQSMTAVIGTALLGEVAAGITAVCAVINAIDVL